jgi:hypothetical protein
VVQVRLVSEATECTGVRFTSETEDTIVQAYVRMGGLMNPTALRGKKKGGSL